MLEGQLTVLLVYQSDIKVIMCTYVSLASECKMEKFTKLRLQKEAL